MLVYQRVSYGSSATRARHMSLFSLSLDATESFPWSRRSRPFGGCALFCGAMGLIDVDEYEAQATFPAEPLHITGLH